MSWLKLVYAFLNLIPEIFKFIEEAQKRAGEQALKEKVKEDLQAINKAFEEKDAQALNDIFANR